MTKHWNHDEARGLKAQGVSWDEIGRIFGVSTYRARIRLDKAFAERKRAQTRANREHLPSLGKRDHVKHVVPEPVKADAEPVDTGPFMTPSGTMAYRVAATGNPITLPFVSILGGQHV